MKINLARSFWLKSNESRKAKSDPLISEKVPNQIQDLNKTEAKVTLSTIHLLHNLLSKNFGFYRDDISSIQNHCIRLNEIIQSVKHKQNTLFVLKNNILYKQHNEDLLLAIPAVIAKVIIFKLHTVQGFHFNSVHLQSQLNKLIYTKNLKALYDTIVHQCLVCM